MLYDFLTTAMKENKRVIVSVTYGNREKKLMGKEKKRPYLPPSFYGSGDRFVIYWSGRISAKDLGVTCSRRFPVFFTCSWSSFWLLKQRYYPSFSSSFGFFYLIHLSTDDMDYFIICVIDYNTLEAIILTHTKNHDTIFT